MADTRTIYSLAEELNKIPPGRKRISLRQIWWMIGQNSMLSERLGLVH